MSGDVTQEEVKKPQSPAWSLNKFNDAIKGGDVDKVTELLKHPNCDINERDSSYPEMSPLMYATQSDSPHAPAIVSLLLQNDNSSATVSDGVGMTALMYATWSRSPHAPAIVSLLLQNDTSSATVSDEAGMTALMHATWSPSPHAPAIVSLLLQNDTSSATVSDERGMIALMHAMRSNSPHAPAIVSLLLKTDPNSATVSDGRERTALMHATRSDSPHAPAIVSLLLEHDTSSATVSDGSGMIALMHAARSNSPHAPAIVSLLLQNDTSSATVSDKRGMIALMHAAGSKSPHAPEIVSLLLKHDPNSATVSDRDGRIALMHAAGSPSLHAPEIVSLLLKTDPTGVSKVDDLGFTGFIHAVHMVCRKPASIKEFCEIMNMLQHGDYTGMQDSNRYNGLDHLLLSGYLHNRNLTTCEKGLELFKMLSNETTNNTLPLAIAHGSIKICDKLLQMNKELVNTSLPCGETVLHSAIGTNSVPKCRLVMKFDPNIRSIWKGLLPLELAILSSCESEIIELVSEKMTMSEIEISIKKCLRNGESVLDLVHNVGIQKWINYFETSKSNSETNDTHTAQTSSKQLGKNIWKSWLYLKEHCSFKLRIPSPRYSKRTNKIDNNVASVAKHCRKMIEQNKGEVKQIQQCVTKLIQDVAKVLSQQKSFMAFRCVLAGSMCEDTKVYAPNELDFIGEFIETFGLQFEENRIRCDEPNPWSKLSSMNGYLDMRLVAQAFYDLVADIVRRILGDKAYCLGRMFISQYPLQRMDKISQLKLIWRGDSFPELTINVDLVPAFKHPSHTKQLPLITECNEFYLLAKSSRHVYTPATAFHLSYCRAELAVMTGLPPYIRDGYIFAKAIRIADIAGDGISLEVLDVEEDIRTDDFLTSYILKNSLFHILQKSDIKESIEKCRYAWAMAIYDELEESLDREKIRLWHSDHMTLLDCRECYGDDRACCQKRAIMSALVEQIREWLEHNIEELRKD